MKKEKSIQADIEETLEVLEQIQSSVEFYEKDKPEFVEALSSAISWGEERDSLKKENKELRKKIKELENA